MKTNADGLSLLKSFESCKLTAYRDVGGILTVGWGHCGPDVHEGLTITQEQADELLRQDLAKFEAGVTKLVTTPITSNQYSAMVCFAFNIGLGNLKTSLLLRCVNSGHPVDASKQFERWNKVKGVVVNGLTRRRIAERDLFLKDFVDYK